MNRQKAIAIERRAEYKKAVKTAVNVLRFLVKDDSVASFFEDELDLEQGALKKALGQLEKL